MPVNRRTFLAASLGTGLALHGRTNVFGEKSADLSKLTKQDLPTPALLVDLDRLESNLQRMTGHCKQAGCGFRPHAKTHKCPEIAKRQVASGALGISVATVSEAEAMVRAGIRGVLLTSPIVEPLKTARMAALAKSLSASPDHSPSLMLAVGHPKEVELLAEAGEAERVNIDILIDLDVGDRRTGILPGRPALELAQWVAKHKSLRLRGVQAYSGRASHTVGFEQRKKVSQEAMGQAVETREQLTKAGFDAAILSGGSTGTYNIDSAMKGVTELQVGSYVFMDVDYHGIGGQSGPEYNDFQFSLTVLSTVVNATHPDRVTIDAGNKSFATDRPAKPAARDFPALRYDRAGDEFGMLTSEKGGPLPKLGDRLEFLVSHCDPTVNLYDRIYAMRGDRVEAIWPVAARKE